MQRPIAWACGFAAYQLVYPGTVPGWADFWVWSTRALDSYPQLARLVGGGDSSRRASDVHQRFAVALPQGSALNTLASVSAEDGSLSRS